MQTKVSLSLKPLHKIHPSKSKNYRRGVICVKRRDNSLAFKMLEVFGLDNAWVVWKESRGRADDEVNKRHEKFGT